MKRLISPLLLVVILSVISTGWRSSPPPMPLQYPVSMTLDGNRLFVSDTDTGLHVYDVSSLTAPSRVIRIPIPGNVSSAVKGDIIYTNSYEQLQAIRVTGDSYKVVATIGAVYSQAGWYEGGGQSSSMSCVCVSNDYSPVMPAESGGGGSSYATFALIGDDLYRVYQKSLVVYDVSTQEKPKEVSRVPVGWDIETIYPTQNLLFVGGLQGMYVFDRSDSRHPKQISQIQHARACDPVVVDGPTAYVTLRAANGCGTATDELLCVSIKDPAEPRIIGEKALATPWGLAVKESQLYVSHGTGGYSLMDVSVPSDPAVKATWAGQTTRDFIWSGNTLFVLEAHNVSIYDVTDPLTPKLLSKVEPETS